MDPKAEGRYRSRALRCHACATREHAAEKFGSDNAAGIYFTVERLPDDTSTEPPPPGGPQ